MYAGSLRLWGAMGLSFDLAFDFPFAFCFGAFRLALSFGGKTQCSFPILLP